MTPPKSVFPKLEEDVLNRWKTERIFEQTLDQTKTGPRFVFFEGPPTANGKPGIHHVLARAFKDAIPRYKTMRGFYVERKAGWDTQGLPVELEVEKKLGLKSKKEIEAYGIEKFNQKCRASVWEYVSQWTDLTERVGFWLDLDHPYITYDPNYIETLWWVCRQIWDTGLLYRGHKVVPQCPRCGTTLSSHEVAQGYQSVTERSVYVKFKVKKGKGKIEPGDYILSWTTTPWTLPGNVALAVAPDLEYVLVHNAGTDERFIVAKALAPGLLLEKSEQLDVFQGKDLVGISYEPLFPDTIPKGTAGEKKAFKVYAADFVTVEDGTGIVHTAVMYGEDDYNLGTKVGLPKHHTVTEDGHFTEEVKQFSGRFVKDKDTDQALVDLLKEHGLLYREEHYTHDYPFCWRCHSPLIYYAKASWFIKMSALRDELKSRNAQINWVPDYIKEGRFGEWLNEVKDWAFSRERYWGTPLPIWICEKDKTHTHCVGSFDELDQLRPEPNKIFLVRHGESETQIKSINGSWPETEPHHLTDKGRSEIQQVAVSLKGASVDLIVSSDLQRTKETADIIHQATKAPIEYDARLRDIDVGPFNGLSYESYHANYASHQERFDKPIEGCENLRAVRARMFAVVRDLQSKHRGKTIVIVSHGDPIWMLQTGLLQLSDEACFTAEYPAVGTAHALELKNVPYGPNGGIDPHRPFIDDLVLKCPKCGHDMRRVHEVCDAWFDSGSMPYAQWHYPFENQARIDDGVSFPAEFIAEAIDQTRGWFYTLLAIATALGKDAPYKNVICLGHIMDDKGRKMSKSLGNIVDPWSVIGDYGADATRFLFYSMNQPGDVKLFDQRAVEEVVKKVFLILTNVISFYELNAGEVADADQLKENVLDRWVLARTAKLTQDVTDCLERYDLTTSSRQLAEFVNELSTWYIRRSRGRLRGNDPDAVAARTTLKRVLDDLIRLFAPFTPFLADSLYLRLNGAKPSVHLESWPEVRPSEHDESLLESMKLLRQLIEYGHAIRSSSSIRVRQPLGRLVVKGAEIPAELIPLLIEELNVRAVETAAVLPVGKTWAIREAGKIGLALDTEITEELRAAGWLREILRNLNDARKGLGLQRTDPISVKYRTDDPLVRKLMEQSEAEIKEAVSAVTVQYDAKLESDAPAVNLDGHQLSLRVEAVNPK